MSDLNSQLVRFLIAQGDDAVVLGHRLSEWCSNGPYLEEDIALTNCALDYIGRARMFYQYAAELEGKGRTEDDIAYLRNEREYTNLLIMEQPRGDFAFTQLRQYFVDQFYVLYLDALSQSKDAQLAAIASKALKESRYHLKRSKPWVTQLAQGTEESRQRIEKALEELVLFVGELFLMPDWEQSLAQAGLVPDRAKLQAPWQQQVQAFLAESELEFADVAPRVKGGREGYHTEHLGHMLAEMQYMQRAYPGLEW